MSISIQIDSRVVQPGDLFISIPCKNEYQHIEEAKNRGASYIFSEKNYEGTTKINDAYLLASKFARIKYPYQPKNIIAITGTNGKSSVAHFIHQLWNFNNIKSTSLGTIGLYINQVKQKVESNLTTPDAFTLHKILSNLKDIDYFVFEASSAALDQKRLHSVDISTAIFTNFASDHLDYHKTREEYFKSKLILFKDLITSKTPAIIYGDDKWLTDQIKKVHSNIITFGLSPDNNIYASNIKEQDGKILFDLNINGTTTKNLEINLIGKFQLLNVLAALAALYPLDNINKLSKLTAPNGRMEFIKNINGAKIFIDYAHTSKAFEEALNVFKKLGRVICVFGCGGDRDKSKRSEFGTLAHSLADISIITDDNPRNEDPAIIRAEILKSCPNGIEIANRGEAIAYAISLAIPGDIVVIFGKGHEEYQIYGSQKLPFSDRESIMSFSL